MVMESELRCRREIGADRLVALTSLRRKGALRRSWKAGQRRSYRTVTGHYRHIINVGLRIAAEAEALRILIIGAPRTDLRWCCGLWQGRDPVGERLRNVRSELIGRPDLTRSRRLARTLHIATAQVGNRRTENDRTRAIRFGEIRSGAVWFVDSDLLSGRRAGRGGAERKISLA